MLAHSEDYTLAGHRLEQMNGEVLLRENHNGEVILSSQIKLVLGPRIG